MVYKKWRDDKQQLMRGRINKITKKHMSNSTLEWKIVQFIVSFVFVLIKYSKPIIGIRFAGETDQHQRNEATKEQ